MWKKLTYKGYQIEAKVYDEGSVYGIDEGRISKLWISHNGTCVVNYDRGWDIEPSTPEVQEVYDYVISKWN